MERAGRGLCAGRESVLNAVPEGGSAAGLTATIGPWTVVRWVPGGPGPCLNFLSALHAGYFRDCGQRQLLRRVWGPQIGLAGA